MQIQVQIGALCLMLVAWTTSAIPVFQVKGTHYKVGIQIGQRFRKEIQEYFSLYTNLRKVFVPWAHTPEGRKVFSEYLAVVEKTYPQYLKEMAGYAVGANVPVEEVQLINFRVELETLLKGSVLGPDACTEIFVNNAQAGCVGIGHNEDNDPIIASRAYILDVHTFEDRDECLTAAGAAAVGSNCKEERFTSYSYPGELPGTAFGFNYNGIILSGNALYPHFVLTGRTGRQILNRAMQGARSIKEIGDILQDLGYGAAYGYSSNNAVLQHGRNPAEMYNFEVVPDPLQRMSLVSKYKVLPASGQDNATDGSGFYYHVNLYRRLRVAEMADRTRSSVHRDKKIRVLPAPKSITDIKNILGDTSDKDYPIFRRPTSTDGGMTLCTAIYNFKECRLDIFDTNPKLGLPPVNTFDLPGCQMI